MKFQFFFNVVLSIGLLLVVISPMTAQDSAQMTLKKNKESNQICYDVALKYEGNSKIMIASQNYRFFYSSATLDFDEETSVPLLPEETYTYRLVQHQNHVDGSSIGQLSFDKDLGFINASVILNNTNSLGAGIDRIAPELKLLKLCFNKIGAGDQYIIPAREAMTRDYGRAYIDVSYVDEEGKISSLDFSSFKDIHVISK